MEESSSLVDVRDQSLSRIFLLNLYNHELICVIKNAMSNFINTSVQVLVGTVVEIILE